MPKQEKIEEKLHQANTLFNEFSVGVQIYAHLNKDRSKYTTREYVSRTRELLESILQLVEDYAFSE